MQLPKELKGSLKRTYSLQFFILSLSLPTKITEAIKKLVREEMIIFAELPLFLSLTVFLAYMR